MKKLVGILLAAGSAQRFGAHKLMHPLQDGTPIAVAAARVLVQALPNTVAVVKPGDQRLIEALTETGVQIVVNQHADEGMGTSLAAGVNATADRAGWLITLADMPWLKPSTISALADRLNNGASIIAPVYAGRRGHPVGFSSLWQQQLRNLSGDQGARNLIADNSAELELITTDDAGVLKDIDFPHDLNC